MPQGHANLSGSQESGFWGTEVGPLLSHPNSGCRCPVKSPLKESTFELSRNASLEWS